MPRLAKVGALGSSLQKSVQEIDNATLATIEHTGLYFLTDTLMPSNSSLYRKIGIFMGISIAYNLLLSRVQSSESSGVGR